MLGILLALLLLATGCEIRVVKSYPNCPEPLVEDLIEEPLEEEDFVFPEDED